MTTALRSVRSVVQSVLHLIPETAVLPVAAGPLRGMRWLVGSGTPGNWLGRYERPMMEHFATLIRPGHCVVDIGANAGAYSLLAAKHGARVYSVEPSPTNVGFLHQHVALNGLADRMTVIAGGCGRTTRRAMFDTSVNLRQGGIDDTKGTIPVHQYALDDLRRDGTIPGIDVLKIDVEGYEGEVLEGARRVLAFDRPVIVLELHQFDPAVRAACLAILRGYGYRLSPLDAGTPEEANHIVGHATAP